MLGLRLSVSLVSVGCSWNRQIFWVMRRSWTAVRAQFPRNVPGHRLNNIGIVAN